MKQTIELHKKWKADPSKGEVFTPSELVCEMLDKIPSDVWKNPESKFLDPCMGKGTFIIEIVKRLIDIYGYSKEDAISRVYGYDTCVKYVNHLKRGGFVNIFHKDFLTVETNMKFNVIIGNPPFQNSKSESDAGKLYIDITKKSISLLSDDGFLSFITPETIIRDGRNKFNIKNFKGLKYVNHTTNQYFKVGINIVSWLIDKNHIGHVSVINKNGVIDFRKNTETLVDKEEVKGVKIFEKLKLEKSKLFVVDQSGKDWQTENGEDLYEVNKNINKTKLSYTAVRPKLYGKRKLVISMSSSYKSELVYDSYCDFGELHVMCDITDYTENQINNLKGFLFNPICVQICDKYKKLYKKGFNSMLYLFPQIDVNKTYTNQDVQDLFKLTNEEVEFLLS